MKKKFTLLFLAVMLTVGALAQKPTAVIYKASETPVIDGEVDDVWAEAPANNIDKEYEGREGATLGAPGETTWQALWTEEGFWVLLIVADDSFFPYYNATTETETWQNDKTELYFDVNYLLEDGGGPLPDWVGGGNGHYQVEPAFTDGSNDGTLMDDSRHPGIQYAFNVLDPNYIAEYFVPFSILTNDEGGPIDLTIPVGFDVYVIDKDQGDATYTIAVWSNAGPDATSGWNNMDECGIITFDGAEPPVYITGINLTGGAITENNGTLQVVAEVLPPEATEAMVWSIEDGADGGRAKIDKSTGLVTAVLDGTVTVTCQSASGFIIETVDVTISDQIVSLGEINVIRNPNFDRVNANGTATEYGGGSANGAPQPQVVDGEAMCTPNTPVDTTETWYYQFNQSSLTALPDIDYEFSFVARADETRTFSVDFEDTYPDANYNNYGATNDPRSTGRSWWTFEVTDQATRYTFDVNFDQINDNTIQTLVFQLGLSDVVCYLDSLVLVSLDDKALITDYIAVTSIDVTGADGATTVPEGSTLQMSAEVLPADAFLKGVRWSVVPGTGDASIDADGLLTGDTLGSVTVVASAKDDSKVTGERVINVSWPAGIAPHSVKAIKVYPNPAVNELNVVLSAENSVVSIYNSVGMKMDEALVIGTEHKFDISRYADGVYFVKTSDSIAKFIK